MLKVGKRYVGVIDKTSLKFTCVSTTVEKNGCLCDSILQIIDSSGFYARGMLYFACSSSGNIHSLSDRGGEGAQVGWLLSRKVFCEVQDG